MEHFRQINPSFLTEYYKTSKAGQGRKQRKPKPKLEDCGIERGESSQMIIARKALFDKAVA